MNVKNMPARRINNATRNKTMCFPLRYATVIALRVPTATVRFSTKSMATSSAPARIAAMIMAAVRAGQLVGQVMHHELPRDRL